MAGARMVIRLDMFCVVHVVRGIVSASFQCGRMAQPNQMTFKIGTALVAASSLIWPPTAVHTIQPCQPVVTVAAWTWLLSIDAKNPLTMLSQRTIAKLAFYFDVIVVICYKSQRHIADCPCALTRYAWSHNRLICYWHFTTFIHRTWNIIYLSGVHILRWFKLRFLHLSFWIIVNCA